MKVLEFVQLGGPWKNLPSRGRGADCEGFIVYVAHYVLTAVRQSGHCTEPP